MVDNVPWPPSLREIADIIGNIATEEFIIAFGGRNVRIPRSPTQNLVNAIGLNAAEKLCQKLAEHTFEVPQARAARAILMRRRGIDKKVIICELKISKSQLRRWV